MKLGDNLKNSSVRFKLLSVFSNRRLTSFDFFSPRFIFPIFFFVYILIGIPSLTNIDRPSPLSIIILLLGLLFFLFGCWLESRISTSSFLNNLSLFRIVRRWLQKIKFAILHIINYFAKRFRFTGTPRTQIILIAFVFVIGGIIASAYILISLPIPLLYPEYRTFMSTTYGFASIAILGVIILSGMMMGRTLRFVHNYSATKRYELIRSFFPKNIVTPLILTGLISIIMLLLGYRTLVIIPLASTVIIYHYTVKPINANILILLFILSIIFIGVYADIRWTLQWGEDNYDTWLRSLDADPNLGWMVQINMASRETLNKFDQIVTGASPWGYYQGDLLASVFTVILPGSQDAPRTLVSKFLETRPESSTTPTIMGLPFLDFGYIGAFFFMVFSGVFISIIYRKMRTTSGQTRRLSVVLYSYTITIFLLSIHTGIADITVIFHIALLIFLLFLFSEINYANLNSDRYFHKKARKVELPVP